MSFEFLSGNVQRVFKYRILSGKPFQVLATEYRKERRAVSAMNTGSVGNNEEADLSSRRGLYSAIRSARDDGRCLSILSNIWER